MSDLQQLIRKTDNALIERLFVRGDLAGIKDLYNEKLTEVFISLEENDKLRQQIAAQEAAFASLRAEIAEASIKAAELEAAWQNLISMQSELIALLRRSC